MHEIKDHQTNDLNKAIKVVADDRSEDTGGSYQYDVFIKSGDGPLLALETFMFQKGPVHEFGINGLTNEVLLAIVIDRLRGFLSGPFTCRENAMALMKLEEGLMWLQARTRDRIARGVEDTYQQ
jgi:hypothetical protein